MKGQNKEVKGYDEKKDSQNKRHQPRPGAMQSPKTHSIRKNRYKKTERDPRRNNNDMVLLHGMSL
jgi:hypothetical protein